MQMSRNPIKPSIMIWVTPHAQAERKLREVQAGIEEEGVPYTLFSCDETDAVALAYQGAAQSQLGVGVGIGETAICVHFAKLPADQPLFVSEQADQVNEWRRCGYNAARLVKGIPFKMDQTEPAESAEESNHELVQLIRELVIKVVNEHAQAMGR